MPSINLKGILCVFGGFLIHFSLGTIYTFGNISPYMVSYLKFVTKVDVVSADMVWVFAGGFAFQGLTMTFGGILNKKIGPRFTTLIGCWTMSFAVMITYFTIKVNLYLTILTYGVFFGTGIGIAYSVAIASAVKWFPNRRGLVIGIVVAGFGLGSLVFNQIQTLFINPGNLSPNITVGTDKYFGDLTMLNRVPNCFLLIGGIYAGLQFIGCMLQFTPSVWEIKDAIVTFQVIESENAFKFSDQKNEVMKNNSDAQTVCSSKDVTTPKSLRKRDFWILWLTLIFTGTVNIFTTSLYKTFGQLFISDDYFLALVGSIASIFNATGRIFWGQVMDRFSYKTAMRIITITTTILIGTFFCCKLIVHESGAKAMHSIWVCAILANICGIYALMPAATAKLFGIKNVATIYGMLFTANAIASMVGALTTSILLTRIGYLGIFEIGAGMTIIAFMLTFFHANKDL